MYISLMYTQQESKSEFAQPTYSIKVLTFRTRPTGYIHATLVTQEGTLRLFMVKVTSVYIRI